MPSVLITGASRGIGYAFLTYYASQPNTTAIGLVRNKEATLAKLAKDGLQDSKNIHLVVADITDLHAVQAAADAVSKITGGKLDILYNNAAHISQVSQFKTIDTYPSPEELNEDMNAAWQANVVGVAHTINAFLPLIRKGETKKVVTLSTGMADMDLINSVPVPNAPSYSISKVGTNALVAKYNASVGKPEGIVFLAISPGVVDTFDGKQFSEEEMQAMQAMLESFKKVAPHWTGPMQPEESVMHMVKVVDGATVESLGGQFISHWGNKEWL